MTVFPNVATFIIISNFNVLVGPAISPEHMYSFENVPSHTQYTFLHIQYAGSHTCVTICDVCGYAGLASHNGGTFDSYSMPVLTILIMLLLTYTVIQCTWNMKDQHPG